MGSDFYFYEQCETRVVPKRYRKLPQELPESLRFAHLNPKVAALLASKERGQRLDNEDPFGDGMGKKSLLPDINASFTNIRNQFDSAMSNDEDSQRYLFEEAKLSAAQVLQQLSRIIYFYEKLYEHIPRSLEYHFMSGYEEFTKDIVVVPREWQTQEMKAQYVNKVQQQEAISEEEMSENELTGRSRSRLQSERSSEVGSKMNIRRSKQKLGSMLDVSEGIEPKRSESRVSLAPSQLRGHLDVGNISRVGSRRKGSSLSSHRSISGQSRRYRDDISLIAETPSEARSTAMANPLSYMQTINFQLSNKSFEEKGWVLLKGRQEEVDQNTVLEYCITRLQECLKDISNQKQKNLDQGYDKSVTVRYYGDSRKETLLKYRKASVKTTSSLNIQKGVKPHIPSIVDECNEGRLLMQASHIDGSTVIYYPSGRPAIVYSAAGFGRPGYYTIVYEDELDSKMLGCFTPSGRGVCYYANGVVRFLATEKGGHLTEENGKLIRKWKWPHTNVKITEPICFQINSHLMFRCVGQNQMMIVFSSQKESARFSVGPAPEADEYRPFEETDQLLTAFTFSSRAAKDLMRIFAPKKQKKKSRKKKKKKNKKKTEEETEELKKKESESLKQVQFSDHTIEVSPVPNLAAAVPRTSISPGRGVKTALSTFRRLSISPGPDAEKLARNPLITGRRLSLSPRTESQQVKKQSATARRMSYSAETEAAQLKKRLNSGRRMSFSPETEANEIKRQLDTGRRMSFSPETAEQVKKQLNTGRRMSYSPGGEAQNVKKQSTTFRRLSYTPGTDVQQGKKLSNTLRKVLGMSSKTESKTQIDKKPLGSQLLVPEVGGHKKQNQDKRAKSARQVSTNDSRDASKGGHGSSANVISSKSSTVDKHIEVKASEDTSKNTSPVFLTPGSESKTSQVVAGMKANLKTPTSILKNSSSKKLDGVSYRKNDNKDVRLCKSAKLKSPSSTFQDLDKRAQSATVSAVSGPGTSETDRSVRHKSSVTIHCEDRSSGVSQYTDSEEEESDGDISDFRETSVSNQNLTNSDTDEVTYKPKSVVLLPVPSIKIIDPDGDVVGQETEDSDDEGNTDSSNERHTDTGDEVKTDTSDEEKGKDADGEKKDSEEGDDIMPDISLLRRRRQGVIFDNYDIEVDEEACDSGEKEKKEAEEESDIMPDNVKFRRQRGGVCLPATDNKETTIGDIKTNKNKIDIDNKDEADKPADTEEVPKKDTRRRSVLMKSIMIFRKKILAKKGIVVSSSSSSSSGTSDSGTDSDDSQTSKSQSSEIVKLLQDFPEKVSYDLEAEKELLRLQRKARNLIDDWMEHYRIALGFKSPLLHSVDDMPTHRSGSRNIKSAKTSNHQLMIRKAVLGLDFEEDCDNSPPKKSRIPSAPLKGEGIDELDEELQEMLAEKHQTVKFDRSGNAGGDGSLSPSALTTINRLTDTASRRSARSKVSSARSGSPSRAPPGPPSERVPSATSGSRSFCPLVIRQQKLNYERPQCRCSRHHIPFIMDIELDDFIGLETQEGQMVVIMIVSSLKNIKNKVTNVDYDFYINKEGVPFHRVFPGITKAEEMLNEIYVNQNRNRTRPCVQSRMDMFRIFKYDINSAAEMSNHTTPLFMTRHNVVPGMFLIYCDGKLLFCDHIFNGYGNARKDFKKQVMKCRHDSIQGLYLPKDFRFSPSKGKSGLRSAWGGEIGGAGVDKYSSSGTVIDTSLQPIHRPTSTPTSSENSQPMQYDAVKTTNRRPFLPRIDANQAGPSQIYPSESINNWLSNSQPGGKSSTFSTTTSYPNSLSETY